MIYNKNVTGEENKPIQGSKDYEFLYNQSRVYIQREIFCQVQTRIYKLLPFFIFGKRTTYDWGNYRDSRIENDYHELAD